MSRNTKINQGANQASKKPYCKVCFDAGKPESEYTSHWVRSLPDRYGKTTVVCPTLLSTECRFCYKLGHTAKFCPVLEQNKKDKERADRRAQVATESEKQKPKVQETKKFASGFDALRYDSDSEEEVKVSSVSKPVEEFPVLGAPKSMTTNVKKNIEVKLPSVQAEVKTGWAAIAAKPKETDATRFMRDIEERSVLKSLPQSAQKAKAEIKPAPWAPDYSKDIYTKSWADWTDSDSDEDEEVQVKPWSTVSGTQTLEPGWSTAVADDDDW